MSSATSQSENDYLAHLARMLRSSGRGEPTLIVDLDRVDANIQQLKQVWRPGLALRLVAKSLAVPALLSYLSERLATTRQMVFHSPFLPQTFAHFPDADVWLGKPMPIAAVQRFYASMQHAPKVPRVTWLVDTELRARELAVCATSCGCILHIALEVDVGLHRGGFACHADAKPTIAFLARSATLKLAGYLGYDAHLAKVPGWLRRPGAAEKATNQALAGFRAGLLHDFPRFAHLPLVWNSGGSHTLSALRDGSPVNELALGSLLLKPTRFDSPALQAFVPALFLATPVLKVLRHTQIPGLESLTRLPARAAGPFGRAAFIYGGRFDADYVYPRGTFENPVYGASYNQTMVHAPTRERLDVDDYVLLRPRDSEFVLNHYGPICVVRAGEIVGEWAPFTWQ